MKRTGFLSTANEYSPGNYGMLDLTMALQWVYDNIYAFNGNKDMITVYGPGNNNNCLSHLTFVTFFCMCIFLGAGAAAAGLLAITPGSSHMVRQVFGQVSCHYYVFCTTVLI